MGELTWARREWIVKDYRVTSLADAVLPLIRMRADLYRWSLANAHGRDMHEAVDLLEAALPTTDPVEAHRVTERALTSALKVIARADDSSGIIGDACRRLLALHPVTAAAVRMPVGKLVDWMMAFQFDGIVDYFELDVVDYAPALGDIGLRTYRQRLDAYAAGLGPRPSPAGFLELETRRRVVHAGLERVAGGCGIRAGRDRREGAGSREMLTLGARCGTLVGLEWHPLSELNPAAATASRPCWCRSLRTAAARGRWGR